MRAVIVFAAGRKKCAVFQEDVAVFAFEQDCIIKQFKPKPQFIRQGEQENQEVFVIRKASRTKSFKQFLREGK